MKKCGVGLIVLFIFFILLVFMIWVYGGYWVFVVGSSEKVKSSSVIEKLMCIVRLEWYML